MQHTIREAMTPNPKTVAAGTSAQEAARLMQSEDVGSIPIVDGDRLIGIVTDRDIATRLVAEGKGPETTVGEIASQALVTIDPQQSLDEAARLMGEHQLRRLPVCEEDGKLVGILAQADIAQSGHDSLTGDTVQRISS
ncbi:MAG: CBS domain-containing protein [Actinomycetota bacterium]|nr:CBS domain-containing protein [Actinomycetota bacterium]